jgi:hypothetical protein
MNKEKYMEVDEDLFEGLALDLAYLRLEKGYGKENVKKYEDNSLVFFYDEGQVHIVVPYAFTYEKINQKFEFDLESIKELYRNVKEKAVLVLMPIYINMKKNKEGKYFIDDLNKLRFEFGQAIRIVDNPFEVENTYPIC